MKGTRREGIRIAIGGIAHETNTLTIGPKNLRISLATDGTLRGLRLSNGHTETVAALKDSTELTATIDEGAPRITIGGWRGAYSCENPRPSETTPDFVRPEFDDRPWRGFASPIVQFPGDHTIGRTQNLVVQARTHVFVPRSWEGTEVHLVLGGRRLFDYRETEVYVGGSHVATRRVPPSWHDPGDITIPPKLIRYGQDTVIALRLRGQISRTGELDAFDPTGTREHTWQRAWPAQYEQYLYAGDAPRRVHFAAAAVRWAPEGDGWCEVDVGAADDTPLAGTVRYAWDTSPEDAEPTLRKTATLTNVGNHPIRVLEIGLGDYRTDRPTTGGEQGFPVHVNDEIFLSIAHPAGWACGDAGRVTLSHYPGRTLAPGATVSSMEAVYGSAEAGDSVGAFRRHLYSRMRRVRRGHDRWTTIFTAFGSWDLPTPDAMLSDEETEQMILDGVAWTADAKRTHSLTFDYHVVDFWCDRAGDMERPDPQRFPNGLQPVHGAIREVGAAPGFWIDTTMGHWNIGDNPSVHTCLVQDAAYRDSRNPPVFCRATDPFRSYFLESFLHHIDAGVRLVKFDNFLAWCTNPAHTHLPGIYSTEANHTAAIDFLTAVDERNPDVFIMLYWGYRSPWWLLWADTIFESGLCIEASSPAPTPTLYARSGVISGIDAVREWVPDVPPLGKDSLGTWLSDWGWNSSIGSERWADAYVMDLARGSLLGQIWSDHGLLDEAGRADLTRLSNLARQHERCFASSRPILGNPSRAQPYGYVCSDGRRAFVAVHNSTWTDAVVSLSMADDLGLPPGPDDSPRPTIVRHHPSPAVVTQENPTPDRLVFALRPFAVILLEVAPDDVEGLPATTGTLPASFHTATRKIAVRDEAMGSAPQGFPMPPRTITFEAPRQEGLLVIAARAFDATGAACLTNHPTADFRLAIDFGGASPAVDAVLGRWTYPVGWQAWRIALPVAARPEAPARGALGAEAPPRAEAHRGHTHTATVACSLPGARSLACDVWFIPDAE